MRITFTRHGESQANLINEISNFGLRHGLTRKGRLQAVTLAQRLQGTDVERIYSSPVLRAIETSVILAQGLDVEYEITEALREFDCGILEGRSDDEAIQQWHEGFDAWTVHQRFEERIGGGESFNEVRDRFIPFIEALVKQYAGSAANLVCVAHGGLFRLMLPLVLKNVDPALIGRQNFPFTSCIVAELRPAGLFCVEWDGHAVSA